MQSCGGVEVAGSSVHDVRARLGSTRPDGWIVIQVLSDPNTDASPRWSEEFQLTFNSLDGSERFTRVVKSGRELEELMRELIAPQIVRARERRNHDRKRSLEEARAAIAKIDKTIKEQLAIKQRIRKEVIARGRQKA